MNEKDEKADNLIYEIGYHIVPLIDESEILVHASKIRSLIEEKEGIIISEDMPKLINLAYEISKSINTKKQKFNKAYFGSIKFEADPSQVMDLKNKIENLSDILRFLIIKTVRENTIHAPKIPMFKKENKEEGIKNHKDVSTQTKPIEKVEISEEEMDKSIDELVIEN